MVLNISFSAATEAKLREQSQIAGKPIEQIVVEAVESELATTSNGAHTQEERVRLWKELVASHPRREGINLDDSRDSIYGEHDE
jgi:hypothetical protein